MDYEKLGVFYLGLQDERPFLYDARDLLTHAVIVGMTGSGKTGLGVTLLEEAAIDGIPALVIDPKGDLANLALRLDPRRPDAFRPWVDPDAARRAGVDVDAFAAREAARVGEGLAATHQSPDRIALLSAAGGVTVYTPGSTAVRPLSVVRSFARPGPEVLADADLVRTAIATAASSLLALVGVDADPVQSREHVLLSTLIDRAWRSGQDLALADLVAAVAAPALDRVGALPLETFFPSRDRSALAVRLNTLLASPAFAPWLEGDPLDVAALLYDEGKPRTCVLSIAHLGDAERMFFVSLLLGQVLTWMRGLPGTSSLRAVLYMDEVAGYLPPVANPASKPPFLALLKQARAFGLGLVLATQNPVDLDYKALSNAGTWFVGRLQTERDKLRLLDGLEGIGVDRAAVDGRIGALKPRRFLVHDVHAAGLVEIGTRFALSYLRGPLPLAELARLAPEAAPAPAPAEPASPSAARGAPTAVAAALPQLYVPALTADPTYRPGLLGVARVHVADAKLGVDHTEDRVYWLPLGERDLTVDWARAEASTLDPEALDRAPAADARFEPVPVGVAQAKTSTAWAKGLAEHVYRTARFEVHRSKELGVASGIGEGQEQLRARIADQAREARDARVDALREKHATKLRALEERIAKAKAAVDEQQAQATSRKVETAVSFGATLLGALLGTRGSAITQASNAAKGVSRAMKESDDVGRASASLQELEAQHAELTARIDAEIAKIGTDADPAAVEIETVALKPKKTDVEVRLVALAWRA